jgi:ribosome biogenesis GTPase A
MISILKRHVIARHSISSLSHKSTSIIRWIHANRVTQAGLRPHPTTAEQARLYEVLKNVSQFELNVAKENGIDLDKGKMHTKLDSTRKTTILVVGETSGKSTIINAMLDDDSVSDAASDKIMARPSTGSPMLIQFGSDVAMDGSTFTAPTRWLNDYNVQIVDAPSLHLLAKKEIDEMLHHADVVVLVTDTLRRLTSPRELELLQEIKALELMKNLVIVVNHADRLSEGERQQVVRQVTSRVRNNLSTHGILDTFDANDVPIVLTSAILALEAPSVLRQQARSGTVTPKSYQDRLKESGLDRLRQYVIGHFLQVDQRPFVDAQSQIATATAVLKQVDNQIHSSRQILANVDGKVEKVVAEYANSLERINYDLSRNEGVQIEQLLDRARGESSDLLKSIPVRKLWFASDDVIAQNILMPIFGHGAEKLGVSRVISLKVLIVFKV